MLLQVSSGGGCEKCAPWDGEVLSDDGSDDGYVSLDEAVNDGLLHANCSHTLDIYALDGENPDALPGEEDLSEAEIETGVIDEALANPGGFSIDTVTGTNPTKGYMVGMPEHAQTLEGTPSREDIKAFLDKHADVLAKDNVYFGGWQSEGKTYLNASENILNREAAIQAGTDRGEIAIYDVKKGVDISTGGTGEAQSLVNVEKGAMRGVEAVQGQMEGLPEVSLFERTQAFKAPETDAQNLARMKKASGDASIAKSFVDLPLPVKNEVLRAFEQVGADFPGATNSVYTIRAVEMKNTIWARWSYDGHILSLNEKWFSHSGTFKESIRKNILSGWHNPDPTMASVVNHELGHALEQWASDNSVTGTFTSRAALNAGEQMRLSAVYGMLGEGSAVTGYGATSATENFAEAVGQMYTKPGSQWSELTRDIWNFFKTVPE